MNIPHSAGLSNEAKDLILGLCTSPDRRLGGRGSDQIKRAAFFNGIDFNGPIRLHESPYKPRILYDTDTSNFDPIDPDKLRNNDDDNNDESSPDNDDNDTIQRRDYHGFYEFTFRRFFDDNAVIDSEAAAAALAASTSALGGGTAAGRGEQYPPRQNSAPAASGHNLAGQQEGEGPENSPGPVYV